ncbi:MAG: transposase [Halofilum sp. (in: g-proteobacteria)]|nr:transposase [Halofilum sp. (in: g-proteobacteria)]
MVRYRRNRVPGGTFFFTVALLDRRSDVLVRHVAELHASVAVERGRRPFRIDAYVVLPDHLHAVVTLPPADDDYAGRWRAVKSGFVRRLRKAGVVIPRNTRGESALWQRRFWEHTIRDESDYRRHVDYIHFNPVKHGLAVRVRDWPYSSFHRHVARGILPVDWADAPGAVAMPDTGEPA